MTYDIHTIYTRYKQLTKKQRQHLLATLQSQGIDIVKIEAYEYSDAPGIKHLFFYFSEDSKKAIPYFMLDSKVWEQIQLCIMETESKEDKVTAEAKAAFENMCKTARENNLDMSLDEINAEIREVRRLSKECNGINSLS